MHEDIIAKLKSETAELEKQVAGANEMIRRNKAAIDALEGRAAVSANGNGKGNGHKQTPVTELLLQAAKDMKDGATFDQRALRDKAMALFPTDAERIKTGVYSGVASMERSKKIRRAPGGFQLVP